MLPSLVRCHSDTAFCRDSSLALVTQHNFLLQQAKQGQPQAIVTLLNNRLRLQGVFVAKHSLKNDCLSLMLQGQQVKSQSKVISCIEEGLKKLKPKDLLSATIYARTSANSKVIWKQTIVLSQFASQEKKIEEEVTDSTISRENPISDSEISSAKNQPRTEKRVDSYPTTYSQVSGITHLPSQTRRKTVINNTRSKHLDKGFNSFLGRTKAKLKLNLEYKSLEDHLDLVTVSLTILFLFVLWFIFDSASFLLILPLLVLGCVSSCIALYKNQNFINWFFLGFLGFFLWGLPYIYLIFMPGEDLEEIRRKNQERKLKKELKNQERKLKEELENQKLLSLFEDATVVFEQTASYRGGLKGYPTHLEKAGMAYLTENALIFIQDILKCKLIYSDIMDVTLDNFQIEDHRSLLLDSDTARQLQNVKNIVNIKYLDEDSAERDVKFQIHGALMVQGEEIKAREFLNRILDFKHQFLKPEIHISQEQGDDVFAKLDKLNNLKNRGIISDDEFECKKAKLLEEI